MLNVLLKALSFEFEPYLKPKGFEKLDDKLKGFFLQKYLETFSCNYCSEKCSREYFQDNGKLYTDCLEGIIETKQEIDINSLERYKFSLNKVLNSVCFSNGIFFHFNNIDNIAIIFGEKEVEKTIYRFFYVRQLFINDKLQENILYSLKSWISTTEKCFIITPQDFILDNSSKTFINDNNIQILSLRNLIDNDFIIEKIGFSNQQDIKQLINTYDMLILDSDKVYLHQTKLNLSPMAFKLLKFIALKGKEGLSAYYDDCIEYLWQDDKNDKTDHPKQLQNHRSDINKACQKANIEESIYKNFIKAQNQSYKLIIEPEKIFIL